MGGLMCRGTRPVLPWACLSGRRLGLLHTGGIRYQVGLYCAIIVYNFSPRTLRFTGPTTHRWKSRKQEKISQAASEPDYRYEFRTI
jgi:hypothetical protein